MYTMLCPELTLNKKRQCHDEAAFSQFKFHIIELLSINQIQIQDLKTVTDEAQLVAGVTTLLLILDQLFGRSKKLAA